MSGPYDSDVEFVVMLMGLAFIVLIASAVIQVCLNARNDKR